VHHHQAAVRLYERQPARRTGRSLRRRRRRPAPQPAGHRPHPRRPTPAMQALQVTIRAGKGTSSSQQRHRRHAQPRPIDRRAQSTTMGITAQPLPRSCGCCGARRDHFFGGWEPAPRRSTSGAVVRLVVRDLAGKRPHPGRPDRVRQPRRTPMRPTLTRTRALL
jgi:hypothetical protein